MENTIPKHKVRGKDNITEDELFDTLSLISVLSKNLAKKVLLIPQEEPKEKIEEWRKKENVKNE